MRKFRGVSVPPYRKTGNYSSFNIGNVQSRCKRATAEKKSQEETARVTISASLSGLVLL
jgi:hypothetical protein